MNQVTIADCFLQYGASVSNGCGIGVKPSHFEWQRADAASARFVTDGWFRDAPGKGQVAWLVEPFFLHPENYLAVMGKPFDYVLTHDDYFVQNNRNWLWCPCGGSWVAPKDWGIKPKTKDVSILLSHKTSMRGHQLRHEAVAQYGKRLDIFGLDHAVTKVEALADYRYSIVTENEKSRYWFTEKLIDCFALGTIPIYWGSPDIGRFFNDESIIEVDDLEDIGYWLDRIHSGLYKVNTESIQENLERAREYVICEDWLYKAYPFLFGAS